MDTDLLEVSNIHSTAVIILFSCLGCLVSIAEID